MEEENCDFIFDVPFFLFTLQSPLLSVRNPQKICVEDEAHSSQPWRYRKAISQAPICTKILSLFDNSLCFRTWRYSFYGSRRFKRNRPWICKLVILNLVNFPPFFFFFFFNNFLFLLLFCILGIMFDWALLVYAFFFPWKTIRKWF